MERTDPAMAMLRTRPASARHTARAASLALVLLGALQAEPALASGFSTARFGAEHGTPVTPNPTAVYYNPASLGETEGFHVFVDGSLALRSAGWQHALSESDDDSSAATYAGGRWAEGQPNAGAATLFNVIASPMVGASYKLGDLAFGAGWYVPFGGQATWDKDENYAYEGADFASKPPGAPAYPGPYDGVQRFHTISGAIQSMYFTLAAAYKIPGVGLSIGVSGNLIRSSVKTLRARTVAGDNNLAGEGRSLIDVSGLHASFGVGLMYEAIPKKLWFGASYQAQPGLGEMELTGTLRNEVTGLPAETAVSMYQSLPDIIRLGARWRAADDLEFRLFGDFQRWSVMKSQCVANEGEACAVDESGAAAEGSNPIVNIARDWNNGFGVRGGMSYWPVEFAEVFTGLGYDSNVVPDGTLEPSLSDFHDISVALGGRFAIGKHLHLATSYTHFFYVQRDTTGLSELPQKQFPTVAPDSGGVYSATLGVINVNVDVAF